MLPTNAGSCNEKYCVQGNQSHNKVDANKQTFCQRENVFGDINLVNQTGVCDDCAHGKVRCFTEVVEKNLTCEQICSIADTGNAHAEEVGEHDVHDSHGQNRVQQAPCYAQKAALIFDFKVSRD